ncbi:hypothetical protein TNCV_1458971 [Trichonephila clavipes]|nr:hypothetical protein TNCV_1458971 [Trichonephila clavipes]
MRSKKARLKAEVESRLKAEETKTVEERRMEEERRLNEIIAFEEEMRLKKETWLVEEQIRHVQEEHKMKMKQKQKCLPGERYPDAVAQHVTVEEENGLSRDLSNVPPISADDETYEIKEKPKLPKRKLKELSRMSVTKLQRKVNLKASTNIVFVLQYWSSKREYSQNKRKIRKLAWKLPGVSSSDGSFSNGKRSKTPLNHRLPDRPSNNPLGIISKGKFVNQSERRGGAELG